MRQRINIQYTIDLEELEDEVTRLVNKNFKHLEDVLDMLKTVKYGNAFERAALQRIDIARQGMARADLGLQDCSNIIEGYLNYMETAASNQQPPTAPVEEIDGADVSDLKERLEKFKNSFVEQDEVTD